MRPQTFISSLYGELRGYHRLSIRRQVAANDCLPRTTLVRLAEQRFAHHVHRSIARFPLYAQRVKAHRGSLPTPGSRLVPEELPVWTRQDQIELFAVQERPADSHYVHYTGGSTGRVVRFHVTRQSYEWRTAVMDRAYSWAGAEEGSKSLHIWGCSKESATLSHRIKRAVHVALQRRTYFDVSHEFTDADRAACCATINRLMPDAIVGYSGMLVDLARYARKENALTWKANTLISTAEVLQCGQRELLQAQLAHEVFDSYGSREFMNIGTECHTHSGYHLQMDNLWVEVVDEAGIPVAPGTEGRIVVTDFHNAANPFIRYEVGDRGVMAPAAEFCGCGRPFPLLRRVEGRTQDMIYTRRGRISALSVEDVLEQYPWVEGYQMVQPSRERLIVRVLTRTELTPDRVAPVKARLRECMGDTTIEFERVGELTRRANGKVDLVILSEDAIAAEM